MDDGFTAIHQLCWLDGIFLGFRWMDEVGISIKEAIS